MTTPEDARRKYEELRAAAIAKALADMRERIEPTLPADEARRCGECGVVAFHCTCGENDG